MNPHIVDIFHSVGTIVTIVLIGWRAHIALTKKIEDTVEKAVSNLESKMDLRLVELEKRIDQRFQTIDDRLGRIEQNQSDIFKAFLPAAAPSENVVEKASD